MEEEITKEQKGKGRKVNYVEVREVEGGDVVKAGRKGLEEVKKRREEMRGEGKEIQKWKGRKGRK